MMIFVWPAEREKQTRMVPNMRKKLGWAELHGWYLAWLMDGRNIRHPFFMRIAPVVGFCLSMSLLAMAAQSLFAARGDHEGGHTDLRGDTFCADVIVIILGVAISELRSSD